MENIFKAIFKYESVDSNVGTDSGVSAPTLSDPENYKIEILVTNTASIA